MITYIQNTRKIGPDDFCVGHTYIAISTIHPKPSFPPVVSGNPSLINRANSKTGEADQNMDTRLRGYDELESTPSCNLWGDFA